MKSVLWRVAKCLSYIEEARCLKVKVMPRHAPHTRVAHEGATAHFLKIFMKHLKLNKPWGFTQVACTISLPQLSGILSLWTPGSFRTDQ